MNECTVENVMRELLHKTCMLWKIAEGRFASVYLVEEFILEHKNKNTAQKTERDVRLLERFLKMKDQDRKIEDIPAAELNEFISEFIISVRTKDGNEYKPTSLRSLMASFCFWKWRTKTGKLKIFQQLSWMNSLANLLSPYGLKMAMSTSRLRFEV